jgi:DsbC/DsbD-like thiol-disulfide interchange protein
MLKRAARLRAGYSLRGRIKMTGFSRRFSLFLTAFVLALGLAGGAAAQSFAVTHAKISLIAENNSLQAGQTAMLGVLFDLEKGWHIYWVNPGDSGEPAKIQWQLPAGFQAKQIRWPTPVRLGAGKVIDYGYEGRVLLPVPIQVPADYKAAKPVTVSADIRYLICREVCIPAKAQASLAIPGANAASAAADRELFRSTFENSPKAWPAGWKAQATDGGGFFGVSLETGMSESKADFFPLEEDQIDNAAPQSVTPTARGAQIKLKKSDQLTKPIGVLKGVVVFGPGRAFEVWAPVPGKKPGKK